MVTQTNTIEWQLRIDWDNAGDFSNASADVTSRVIAAIQCHRGRDYSGLVSSQIVPGALSTVLRNSSGDYSFFNTSSPIHNHLRPGCLVQLRSRWKGVWRERWTGFLLDIAPTVDVGGVPAVQISAIGVLGYYNQQPIEVPVQANATSGEVQVALFNAAGVPASDRSVDTGQTRFAFFVRDAARLIDLTKQVSAAELSTMYEAMNGSLVSYDRHRNPRSRTSQNVFSDQAGNLAISGSSFEDPLDHAYSIFRAKVESYEQDSDDVASHARLWTLTGDAIPISPNTSVVIVADADLDREHVAIHTWDAPVFTANSAPDGGGSNKASSLTADIAAQATRAVITLTNNDATDTVYLTALSVDGIRLRIGHSFTVERKVQSLANAVGNRVFPSEPAFTDAEQAEGWTEWQSLTYGQIQPIITITVPSSRDEAHLDAVLALDIADRITAELTGETEYGISGDFFIERVSDTIQINRYMATTYHLNSAVQTDQWWALGQAPINGMVAIPW